MIKNSPLYFLCCVILFAGCKKQRSCQCSSTFEKPGYHPYTVSSIRALDGKKTKKRAEKVCAHAEKQLLENNKDYTGANESVTVSCAVK